MYRYKDSYKNISYLIIFTVIITLSTFYIKDLIKSILLYDYNLMYLIENSALNIFLIVLYITNTY